MSVKTLAQLRAEIADNFRAGAHTSSTSLDARLSAFLTNIVDSMDTLYATGAQGDTAETALQPADVGTAAAEDVGFFATAAQGATADSALQPADVGTAAAENVEFFATAAQGAAATAVSLLITSGAGAPVNYTDGDPVATGQDVSPPGGLYIDTTNAVVYRNDGTAAEPVWIALADVA